MRIIAGERKGFRLKAPAGLATRPTLGRVRESLFMRLEGELADAKVVDLFAGAGTLGLEALSRGASRATFVESSRAALAALRDNIDRLGWGDRTTIIPRDALRWLRDPAPPGGPWNLVLIDPPYGEGLAARALALLGERASGLLTPDCTVVAQVGRRDALQPEYGALRLDSERTYGETRILMFRMAGETD